MSLIHYGQDLISMNRDQAVSYYHYDGLGSTRALSDAAQNVTDAYEYEPYGEVSFEAGTTENAYRFTGEQYDDESGMYYLRARYYAPEIGRFTTMDNFDGYQLSPLTLNKYLYGNVRKRGQTRPIDLYCVVA